MEKTSVLSDIRVIVLDVDQTLLDFNACARLSLNQAFEKAGLKWKDEDFPIFIASNNLLWKKLESKEMSDQQFRQIRFPSFLQKIGYPQADGLKMEEYFRFFLDQSHETMDRAHETLEFLSGRYPLYVLTNGRQLQQEHRLDLAGFLPMIEQVVSSEKAGAMKPQRQIFEYLMTRLRKNMPDLKPEEVLMIGDSYESDIQGAAGYGLSTLWLNQDIAQASGLDIDPNRKNAAIHLSAENWDQIACLFKDWKSV